MKKLKLIFALLLAGSVFMTACGDGGSKNNDDDDDDDDDDDKYETTAETTGGNGYQDEPFNPGTVRPLPVGEYEAGTINASGNYVNEWRGIMFTPTDDENVQAGEDLGAEENTYSDFVMFSDDGNSMVTVIYMDVNGVFDDYDDKLAQMKENWEGSGLTVEDEFDSDWIGGEYNAFQMSMGGDATYIALLQPYGDYIEFIMIGAIDEDGVVSIAERFSEID